VPSDLRTNVRAEAPVNVNNLLWIAGVLILVWIVAAFTKFIAGALLNLLWVAALILLAVWAFRKIF
jgi:hypothetical protein